MSKFEHDPFFGDLDDYAVNAEKYTKDEAIGIYLYNKRIVSDDILIKISVRDAFVRHRAGINDYGEPCVCWWLEYEQHKRSCPVYAFHITIAYEPKGFEEYEIIDTYEWMKNYEKEREKAYEYYNNYNKT